MASSVLAWGHGCKEGFALRWRCPEQVEPRSSIMVREIQGLATSRRGTAHGMAHPQVGERQWHSLYRATCAGRGL